MPDTEMAEAFLCTLSDSHPSVNFTMELAENKNLPFLGMEIDKHDSRLKTKVYKKPRGTGLLLHYQSHVSRVGNATMSALHASTFTNVLKNVKDLRSGVTSGSNMGDGEPGDIALSFQIFRKLTWLFNFRDAFYKRHEAKTNFMSD